MEFDFILKASKQGLSQFPFKDLIKIEHRALTLVFAAEGSVTTVGFLKSRD